MIVLECDCGHSFRKKCKKVCLWESEAVAWNDMFGCDGYVGDGVYVEDIIESCYPDYDPDEPDKFYGDDDKLLPQYGYGRCTKCKRGFWFERVDK